MLPIKIYNDDSLIEGIPVSRINELREKAGLTQRELAQLVGVTESTIRNWENNRNGIEWFVRVAKLCKILNSQPEELIEYVSLEKE